MAICNICMLALLVTRPQEPYAPGRMIKVKIEPDGRQVAFRSLVDRQDALPFGVNPARQMKAWSELRIIQPPIMKVLQAGQRGIAAGLMTLTRASKCPRELLRRLRLPSKGHDVRFSIDLTASTQGTTQSLTDAMSPQPTLPPPEAHLIHSVLNAVLHPVLSRNSRVVTRSRPYPSIRKKAALADGLLVEEPDAHRPSSQCSRPICTKAVDSG